MKTFLYRSHEKTKIKTCDFRTFPTTKSSKEDDWTQNLDAIQIMSGTYKTVNGFTVTVRYFMGLEINVM